MTPYWGIALGESIMTHLELTKARRPGHDQRRVDDQVLAALHDYDTATRAGDIDGQAPVSH